MTRQRVHISAPVLCDHCRRPLAYLELTRAIECALRKSESVAMAKHAHCGLMSVVHFAVEKAA